jgi:hypothetical protein
MEVSRTVVSQGEIMSRRGREGADKGAGNVFYLNVSVTHVNAGVAT